jgi:hypothetical protein
MRRLIIVALLSLGSLIAFDAGPASACGWYGYRGCGCYAPRYYGYSYYRPAYFYRAYYRPVFAYGGFYRPRVWGWRGWGGRGWGWGWRGRRW